MSPLKIFLSFSGGGEGPPARSGEVPAEDSLPPDQRQGQRLRLQQRRQGLLQHPGRGEGVARGDRVQADIPQRQGSHHRHFKILFFRLCL